MVTGKGGRGGHGAATGRRRARRGALALVVALLAAPGYAQVYLPPPPPVVHMPDVIWNQFMMNRLGTQAIGNSVLLDSLVQDMQGLADGAHLNAAFDEAKALPAAPAVPEQPRGDISGLAFEPSGHSLLAARIAASDPAQDAARLEREFSGAYRAYLEAFREEHQRYGMPAHDVAAAFTAYVVLSYAQAHDLHNVDATTSLAVYRQSAQHFLASGRLASMAPQERELLAETLVVLAAQPRLVAAASGDPAQGREAGLANLARVFGPEAAGLRLSATGIGR